MKNRAFYYMWYALKVAFAIWAVLFVLSLTSCATKKKVTDRYKNSESSKVDTETSKIEQKDQTSESERVSEYQQEIIKFLREFEIEPLDNSRSGNLNLKLEKDGSLTVTSSNAKAKGSASTEKSKITGKDSAATKSQDKGTSSENAKTKADAGKKEKGRNSDSESEWFNYWPISAVIGFGILVFALYKKFSLK